MGEEQTYADVVRALEAELGWNIGRVTITRHPTTCDLCGEDYETRPALIVTHVSPDDVVVVSDICPDRAACAERQRVVENEVARVALPLTTPEPEPTASVAEVIERCARDGDD